MQTGGVQGVQELEESKEKEPVKRIGVSAYRRVGASAYQRVRVRQTHRALLPNGTHETHGTNVTDP